MSKKDPKTAEQPPKGPLAEALAILGEIQQIIEPLQKSEGLGKAAPDDAPPTTDAPPAPAGDAPAADAGGGDAPPADAPPAADGGGELAEAGAESEEALRAEAAGLDDQQLEMMLGILMDEHDKRNGGGEGGDAGAAPAASAPPPPPAAPAPAADDAMKSMQKSVDDMQKNMDKMAKSHKADVERLTKELASAKQRASTVVTKPAATNTAQVEALTKSQPVKQRLTKSETKDFILGRMRQGDKSVTVSDMSTLNLIKDDATLASFQDDLKKRGISLPEL